MVQTRSNITYVQNPRQARKCCDSKVRRSSNKPGQARTVAKAAGSDSAALQVPTARHCPARLTVHFPGKLAYPSAGVLQLQLRR